LTGSTSYGAIGFDNDDIKYERNNFLQTFLYLAFYDTDNPMNQRLVSYVTLFSEITQDNLLPDNASQVIAYGSVIGLPGQPKRATDIPLQFVLSSPIFNPRGFGEGYHLYDYKDELDIGQWKYLYMKASFKNAKTGKTTGLMVKNTGLLKIDEVIKVVDSVNTIFKTLALITKQRKCQRFNIVLYHFNFNHNRVEECVGNDNFLIRLTNKRKSVRFNVRSTTRCNSTKS